MFIIFISLLLLRLVVENSLHFLSISLIIHHVILHIRKHSTLNIECLHFVLEQYLRLTIVYREEFIPLYRIHAPDFVNKPSSIAKSRISPYLSIPSPNIILNVAVLKGGAILFLTTFTVVS